MRAVIYARYSSHNQREESIEGQLRVCHDYADREGLAVIKEYTDRAISGTTDNRPAFQKMIADAPNHLFDVVLVYTLDRLARNRYDAAMYRHELKKHGVKIISATQPLSDDPESILLESVLEGIAEYYSANLARGVKRGMHENAIKCQSVGGLRPLGYDVDPATKRYIIDPIGARIVREIFEKYSSGMTLAAIVEYCNESGYRTSLNKKFSRNSLNSILRNRRYTGVYIYNDVEVEGGMPVIIEPELWESVQKRLNMNHKSKSRNKSAVDFFLTGKLFCGHCMRSMCGTSGTSKSGDKHYYYTCKAHGEKCTKQNERKEIIEDAVVNYIVDSFLTDENIEKIADSIVKFIESEDNNAVVKGIEAEIKEKDRILKNLVGVCAQGNAPQSILDEIREIEEQKAGLETQLAQADFEKKYITKDMIIFWFSRFKDDDPDTMEYRHQLTDALINSIYIYDTNENQNVSEGSDKCPSGLGRKLVIAFNTAESVDNPVTLECSDLAEMVELTSLYPNIITSGTDAVYLHTDRMLIIAIVNI